MEKDLFITHFRLNGTKESKGGATVGINRNTGEYAVTVCSPIENFGRARGINEVRKKFNEGKIDGKLPSMNVSGRELTQASLIIAANKVYNIVSREFNSKKPRSFWNTICGVSFRKESKF